jgi:HEPN domain-containing protein
VALGRITGQIFLPHNDPKLIFVEAEQFHEASRLLGRFATLHARHVGHPSIICSAYALELYLKCLIVISGKKPPTIHNLKKLFKIVRPEDQAEIREYFRTKEPEMTRFFVSANRDAGWEMMPPKPDFDQQLKASADAFYLMRYIYEDKKKPDHPIGYFAYPIEDGARAAILRLRPEWKGAKLPYP